MRLVRVLHDTALVRYLVGSGGQGRRRRRTRRPFVRLVDHPLPVEMATGAVFVMASLARREVLEAFDDRRAVAVLQVRRAVASFATETTAVDA